MLLGCCGTSEDATAVENLIRNEDRQFRITLDAMASCWLNLTGVDGMPLIEELFLKNGNADYTDTYGAVMALRFQAQYGGKVPRERLMVGMRYLLERPQFADLIIPDLARWQDWSVMDKLVQMFKEAEETSWVRVPIINYLRQCPLPEAKEATQLFGLTAPPTETSAESADSAAADESTAAETPTADTGSETAAGNTSVTSDLSPEGRDETEAGTEETVAAATPVEEADVAAQASAESAPVTSAAIPKETGPPLASEIGRSAGSPTAGGRELASAAAPQSRDVSTQGETESNGGPSLAIILAGIAGVALLAVLLFVPRNCCRGGGVS
jgi:hypothetical protein